MQYNIDLAKAKGEVLVFNFIIYFKQKKKSKKNSKEIHLVVRVDPCDIS